MGRKAARKHAFCIVYQMKFHKDFEPDAACELYFSEAEDVSKGDTEFILSEVAGVKDNLSRIDELITQNASGWSFDRLSSVDLAIMRLALFEILYKDDIPTSVSINEAVELAKVYGEDDSPAFINGILGTIANAPNK